MVRISQIAALGRNRVIGQDGKLPWSIPEDWTYFKATVKGHPVLLGRKTWEVLEEPLEVPYFAVVTRQKGYQTPGAEVFTSPAEALAALRTKGEELHLEEVFILGGGEIYQQLLPLSDRLYLTIIDHDFAGNAFFPPWDEFSKVVSRRQGRSDGPYPLEFLVLERPVNK